MTRALKKAKAKLQAGGIKVIDWEPFKSMEILQLIVGQKLSLNLPGTS